MVLYSRWVSETRAVIIQIRRGHPTNLPCLIDHLKRMSHQRRPNASHKAPVVVLAVHQAVHQTVLVAAALVEAVHKAPHGAQTRAQSKALEHFQRNNSSKSRNNSWNRTIFYIQHPQRLARSRARKKPLRRRSNPDLPSKSWALQSLRHLKSLSRSQLENRLPYNPWSQTPSLTLKRHLPFHQGCRQGASPLLSKCKTRR